MRLFIAEKPSVARAIANAIGIVARKDGYIECKNNVVVTNCFGHLLERAEPDVYLNQGQAKGSKEKPRWKREDLPIIPSKWIKVVSRDKNKQLKIIATLAKNASEVVNAGDADREGQLLVDEVLSYIGYRGPVLRYWQSSMVDESIRKSLNEIVPNSKFYNWGVSAEARGQADWLIGMNITRQLTLKHHNLVVVGRVQTPVLKIVVDRDRSIENFKEQSFFNIDATFNAQNFQYKGRLVVTDDLLDANGYFTDKNKAQFIIASLAGATGQISDFKVESKKTFPKLMYTLADLQVDCNRKFGYGAKKTLDIAQKLYEEYQLTTYPRASCEYLTTTSASEIPRVMTNLANAFPNLKPFIAKATNIQGNRVFNDKKVEESAHTGIIPTLKQVTINDVNNLPEDCKKVYQLIVNRYIACFMPPYQYKEYTILTKVKNFDFKSVLKQPLVLGFKEFDNEPKEKKADGSEDDQIVQNVPNLAPNTSSRVISSNLALGKTTPPKYFTEGTLIATMKNIAKYISDPEEKKLLKDDDGLGSEATRAEIIERLKQHGFLEVGKSGKLKNKIYSTPQGREILKVIPANLQSASLTAQNERYLQQIQAGTMSLQQFMSNQVMELKQIMSDIDASNATMQGSNSNGPQLKCPKCGGPLYHNESKKQKGKFYFHCGNKECNAFFDDVNGQPVEQVQHNCPKCGQRLVRLESKFKKGEFNWICFNESCKARFTDNNGQVGPEKVFKPKAPRQGLECPSCHQHTCIRIESKKKPGTFFFVCDSCKTFFADNNGQVGNPFGNK